MSGLAVGDVIRDNLGREGIVLERARAPNVGWLAEQDDLRVRSAAGPWWNVVPFDGGGVLVPEDLVLVLRRATVDDVVRVMESDMTDDGRSTLLFLFSVLRSKQSRGRALRRKK